MPNGALIIGGAIVLSTILNIVTRERVRTFMGSAELTEGESYMIKATTTNTSTKAGVPVAASLTINIAAVVNSQVIMENSEVYGFAAEETHTFEFPLAVPIGTGGKAGAVVAEVLDPNGNKLADGSLDVVIAALVVPWAFSDIACWSNIAGPEYGIGWRVSNLQATITNIGTSTATKTITQYRRIYMPYYGEWWTWEIVKQITITLSPGESYSYLAPSWDPVERGSFLLAEGEVAESYLVDSDGYESAKCYV